MKCLLFLSTMARGHGIMVVFSISFIEQLQLRQKKVWKHVLGGKDCNNQQSAEKVQFLVHGFDVTCHLGMSSARVLWGIGPRRRSLNDICWTRKAKRMTFALSGRMCWVELYPKQPVCRKPSETRWNKPDSWSVGSKPIGYVICVNPCLNMTLAWAWVDTHDCHVGISWGSSMDLQRDLWPCDDRWDHCALSMAWKHRSWRWCSVSMTSIIIVDVFPHVFRFEDCLTLKARELKQRFELGHKQNGANVYPSNFSCLINHRESILVTSWSPSLILWLKVLTWKVSNQGLRCVRRLKFDFEERMIRYWETGTAGSMSSCCIVSLSHTKEIRTAEPLWLRVHQSLSLELLLGRFHLESWLYQIISGIFLTYSLHRSGANQEIGVTIWKSKIWSDEFGVWFLKRGLKMIRKRHLWKRIDSSNQVLFSLFRYEFSDQSLWKYGHVWNGMVQNWRRICRRQKTCAFYDICCTKHISYIYSLDTVGLSFACKHHCTFRTMCTSDARELILRHRKRWKPIRATRPTRLMMPAPQSLTAITVKIKGSDGNNHGDSEVCFFVQHSNIWTDLEGSKPQKVVHFSIPSSLHLGSFVRSVLRSLRFKQLIQHRIWRCKTAVLF